MNHVLKTLSHQTIQYYLKRFKTHLIHQMLKPGDIFPCNNFMHIPWQGNGCSMGKSMKPQVLSTELWKKLKVPGAFTPTCSSTHLPGILECYDRIKAKGVDIVAVLSVNDPFVMAAWGDAHNARDKILFLTDTDASFSSSFNANLDLTAYGLGMRTHRYALIIENGIVKHTAIEPDPGVVSVTSADSILSAL
ncbi:hypothetical protein PCANB_002012 [Pneumocystis canis]|nr:hypothetical protein PCANB_002012 [Pneumocystis canis]